MSKPVLKPCPACGANARMCDDCVVCSDDKCLAIGPRNDRDGRKWNALPRRRRAKKGGAK